MAINTQFTTAVHIVLLLNLEKDKPLSSSYIASSVNTNPVVIRRIEALLKQANILEIDQGGKGAKLIKDIRTLTLLDIYKAINESMDLFTLHKEPNPNCTIGKNVHESLVDTLNNAQNALENELKRVTLDEIYQTIIKKEEDK